MNESMAPDSLQVPDTKQIGTMSNGITAAGDAVLLASAGTSASPLGKSVAQYSGAAGDEGIGSAEKRKRKRREFFGDADDSQGKYGKGMRALRQQARPQTYDEAALDSMMDQHIGDVSLSGKGRKKKPMDADKEVNVEAMIAASIGFPRESLTEEEQAAGVLPTAGGPDQNTYIVVRNHILARWRDNVSVWLDEATVMESIRSQHRALVSSAYKFLLQYGYINFGVAPAIKAAISKEPTKGTVIIIGSGLAGLAAARQLLAFGHRVVILEGRQRPGGRVYTKRMEGEGLAAAADLGGSVVTGIHGNPLAVLARQLGYPLHKIREKCPLYQPNGIPVRDVVDSKVESYFNGLLDDASKRREQMQDDKYSISLGTALDTLRTESGVVETEEERMLLDWHFANLEYANAGLLSNLSLAFWDQDDPYEMGGDHCFLAGGNVRLVAALAENLPIFYGTTVQCIKYGEKGVQVECGDQVFEGEMALCTVPLGVLKKCSIKFQPELPQRKLDAVNRLGFGLLNKVVMLFPRIFWGSDLDTFGRLTEDPIRRGEFFLFYSYASVSGGPLLLALIAGEAAINFEQMAPLDAVSRVLNILRGIYEPDGIRVPDPIQTVCTRWGGDSLCYGSYSNVAVGASGEDYDIMAESVGDGRLFFAGEATNRRYPATMHGAFLSGLREAGKIAAHAAARLAGAPARTDRAIPKDIVSYAAVMADIFREPDLEFGSFAVIFDPRTEDPQSSVLLRVVFNESWRKVRRCAASESLRVDHLSDQPLKLYSVISRDQALQLMAIGGGDKIRLRYLIQSFRAKLVGRKGLGAHGDALVAAARWGRASNKPAVLPSAIRVPKPSPNKTSPPLCHV